MLRHCAMGSSLRGALHRVLWVTLENIGMGWRRSRSGHQNGVLKFWTMFIAKCHPVRFMLPFSTDLLESSLLATRSRKSIKNADQQRFLNPP